MDNEVYLVFGNPVGIYSPGGVGNRFIHIFAGRHDNVTLLQGEDRVTFAVGRIVIAHYANDQIVSQGLDLF